MRSLFLILLIALTGTLAGGCDQPSANNPGGQADALSHDDHGHDGHGHDAHGHDEHGHDAHGHDEHGHGEHGHDDHGAAAEEMGPNKGHIIYLSPTDYVAEWRHYKGNNVIRIYVLDANKKSASVNASVSIKSESGKSKQTFELAPEDGDEAGKTAVYMLDEQKLALAMNLGVTISIEIDGKVYEGKVPPHAPHHH